MHSSGKIWNLVRSTYHHHHSRVNLRQHTYRAGIAKIPQKADIALLSSGERIWLDSEWTLKDIIL